MQNKDCLLCLATIRSNATLATFKEFFICYKEILNSHSAQTRRQVIEVASNKI